jgi:hypothetical protein
MAFFFLFLEYIAAASRQSGELGWIGGIGWEMSRFDQSMKLTVTVMV